MKFWSHQCPGVLTPSEYKRRHFTPFVRRRSHPCRIPKCNSEVDWDRSKLRAHLLTAHSGMELERYYEQFVARTRVSFKIFSMVQSIN